MHVHIHITTNSFDYLFVFVSFFLMLYYNKTLLDLIVLYCTTFVSFLFYLVSFMLPNFEKNRMTCWLLLLWLE